MKQTYVSDGLFVKQNDYFIKILFVDIIYIEASRSYCDIFVKNKSKAITVTFPMGSVKKKLPDDIFLQIHRSFIVNILCVDQFAGNSIYCNKISLAQW